MKSLSVLPLGVYEKAICLFLSWEEKLSLLREMGYDFLEVVIDGEEPRINRLYDNKSAVSLNRAILNTGVPALSMTLSANRKYPLGSDDEPTRQKGIEVVRRAVDFALTAGVRIIQIAPYCGGDEWPDALEKYFYASLEQCVAYARERCVTLSLEAIDTQIMKSNRQVMWAVGKLESPFLQVYADIGNLNVMSVGEDDLKAARGHIVGVHIKDSKPLQPRNVPFGEGTVNFGKCFDILADMGYGGILVAEMWCNENPEFHQYLEKANRFIKQALAQY